MPNRAAPGAASQRVIDMLKGAPEGVTIPMIRARLGVTDKAARNAINRLYSRGDLIRSDLGTYTRPYRYTLADLLVTRPTPAPAVPVDPPMTAEAGAALRLIRQARQLRAQAAGSAGWLAGQGGFSYPAARRIWAELQAAGMVTG